MGLRHDRRTWPGGAELRITTSATTKASTCVISHQSGLRIHLYFRSGRSTSSVAVAGEDEVEASLGRDTFAIDLNAC